MSYHLIPVRISIIKKKKESSVGEDAEKRKPFTLSVWMYFDESAMYNSMNIL